MPIYIYYFQVFSFIQLSLPTPSMHFSFPLLATCPTHLTPWHDQPNSICWAVQITKILITYFSPLSCHLFPSSPATFHYPPISICQSLVLYLNQKHIVYFYMYFLKKWLIYMWIHEKQHFTAVSICVLTLISDTKFATREIIRVLRFLIFINKCMQERICAVQITTEEISGDWILY
jgi:hypothetical protein